MTRINCNLRATSRAAAQAGVTLGRAFGGMWGFDGPRAAFMRRDADKDGTPPLVVKGCSETDVYLKLQLRMLLCCGVAPDDPRVEVLEDRVMVPGHERTCDVLPVGYIAGDAWSETDGPEQKLLCSAAMHMQERSGYCKVPPTSTFKISVMQYQKWRQGHRGKRGRNFLNDDVEPGFDALLADELAAASTEVRDLFEACSAAEPHRLRELLDAKADVNLALHETATPLTTVIQASTRGSASDPLACIRLLLEAKAHPDEAVFASDSGTPIGFATPLILACAKEDHALVDLLLEHHAAPDRTGTLSDGCHPMTPLMVAASRGAVKVAESLLRAGDH